MFDKSYLTLHTSLDSSVNRKLKFDVHELKGHEGICEEFSYKLNVSTKERLLNSEIEQFLDSNVTVRISFHDARSAETCRFINGQVVRIIEIGVSRVPFSPDIWRYEIEIGSWLRKLESIKDCRIFQKSSNTSLSIVSELLNEYGFKDYKKEIEGKIPSKKYSVLYNESVANYIRRILLEDGLIWYFKHDENKHTLVFSDNSLNFPLLSENNISPLDSFQSFKKQSRNQPLSEYSRISFDSENSPAKTIKQSLTNRKNSKLKHFEYIPNFKNSQEGEDVVARHCTSLKSELDVFKGESSIRALSIGYRFTLKAPALQDLSGKSFLLRSMAIQASPSSYKNYFKAIPGNTQFRIPEGTNVVTPRVWGPQTALVVGEGGDGNVRTQTEGCIKVRFHWDHLSPKDAKHTSAYIRTAMPGAGNRRGMLFVPRVGEEIVVMYEQGDPDKPIIIGSVYSRYNPPPHKPSSKPFRSTIKNSSDSDSNQIIFDDDPGKESLEIIAKKDMNIDVSDDCNIDVAKNINIKARSVFLVAKDTINVVAGNNIENQSLATIINLSLGAHLNTACGNILDLALGVVWNRAGGLYSKVAGGFIANTSALGIVQSSESLINSTSQALLLNTAPTIINSGGNAVKTKAGLAILNSATEKINNEADKKTNDATLISMTEASKAGIKGNTKIGP